MFSQQIQLSLDNCKTSKETSEIHKALLAKLQSNGFCQSFSVKEVQNKMKKLRQKYKAEKDKTRRSGSNRGKQWKFFNNMDAFLSRKHNIEPPVIIDTMSEKESAISVPNVEEELTQKYGKGKTSLRKCETCDYEQVIQSAGVHASESGAIKVYADDDKFSCPKCDGNEDNLDEVPESLDKNKEAENDNTNDHSTASNTKEILPPKENKIAARTTKKKRKTNMEKSLEVVFQKFQDASSSDFSRHQKWEEEKMQKEYEFRMKQTILENQRRREEREHEMKMLQIIMGYPPEANTQATHLNVHATSDLQYPVHPYISPSSVYESHSSISGDSSHHSSSYFEL